MGRLRRIVGKYRPVAMLLVLATLCLKASIPGGFMLDVSAKVFTVTICSESTGTLKQMQMAIPVKEGHGGDGSNRQSGHCVFAGVANPAIEGGGGFLLAIILAFVLALGLAPLRRVVVQRTHFFLPHLRGPPAAI